MSNLLVKNILRFIILITIQVLVLNNMNLSGYLNPYIYVLFILLLPAKINRSLLLIIAFGTGLVIDYFGNTLGLNAAACLVMAFLRPGIINLLFRNYEFGINEEPGPFSIGFSGFIRYATILVFVFQFVLFYLEVFSLSSFFFTLGKVFLSTILTVIIMLIALLFTSKRKRNI